MTDFKLNFIPDEWTSGESEIRASNPLDLSDPVGVFAQADAGDLDTVLGQARVAQRERAADGLGRKQAVLTNAGNEVMARAGDPGTPLSRKEGEPLAESGVFGAGQFFTRYAADCLHQFGENAASAHDRAKVGIRREPAGVIAAMSPWNFPAAPASWKTAPTLRHGNTVVWKPANAWLASALATTGTVARQDIPERLFILVFGSGRSAGRRMAKSPKATVIRLTVSVPVGCGAVAVAVRNPTGIPDGDGIREYPRNHGRCRFRPAGNIRLGQCVWRHRTETRRHLTACVERKAVRDTSAGKLAAGAKAMKAGYVPDAATQTGPVASQQLAEDPAFAGLSRTEGAKLACGGERLNTERERFHMSRGVFINASNGMRNSREEMLAPLASVIRTGPYGEALSVASDTGFGLTSGTVTQNLARASHFRRNAPISPRNAETGCHVPFGGRGSSPCGSREQGRVVGAFRTMVKTACIGAGAPG